jgi:xanthine dehydrogenase accessory factor
MNRQPPRPADSFAVLDGWDVLEQASELAQRGEEFALATVVWRQGPSSGQQGSRALITATGQLYGWIGGACAEPVVIRQAQRVIAEREPILLLLGAPDQFGELASRTTGQGGELASRTKGQGGELASRKAGQGGELASRTTGQSGPAVPGGMMVVAISCQSEGALQVYIEPVIPTPHLTVVGRSPMAHTLAGLARALGWRADVVDGPEFSAADLNARSIVVVATQGHGDEEAIEQAVSAFPAFVGVVASRKRGEALLGTLADRKVPQHLLDRIRVPVGLDLGHTSHREIAVAILAELVQRRAAGELAPEAPAGTVAAIPVTEALDPVCGMTVRADQTSHPFEHGGVTYYFCCAGCRESFERDPHAYLTAEHASQEA